jgi:hypothetical protein
MSKDTETRLHASALSYPTSSATDSGSAILDEVNIQFALLADAANKAENGKLNLLGVFDRILVADFPSAHAGAVLVARLSFTQLEIGKEFELNFVFVEEDGQGLAAVKGNLKLTGGQAGMNQHTDLIVPFPVMPLPQPGNYRFSVVLNGEDKAGVPLYVAKRPEVTDNAN